MRCTAKTKNGSRCKNICEGKLCHMHKSVSLKFRQISPAEEKFAIILSLLVVARGSNMNGRQAFANLEDQLNRPNLTNDVLRKFPVFRHLLEVNAVGLIGNLDGAYELIALEIHAHKVGNTRFYIIENDRKDAFEVVKQYF